MQFLQQLVNLSWHLVPPALLPHYVCLVLDLLQSQVREERFVDILPRNRLLLCLSYELLRFLLRPAVAFSLLPLPEQVDVSVKALARSPLLQAGRNLLPLDPP